MMYLTDWDSDRGILVNFSFVEMFEPLNDKTLSGSWVHFKSGRQVMVKETIEQIMVKK